MKKVLYGFALVSFLFLLSGCGNKVTCTGKVTDEGNTYEMKVEATFKGDKVEKASASMTFEDEATATSYCGLVNAFLKEGEDSPVKCNGKTLTFDNMEDFMDTDENHELTSMTKEEFIKEMESEEGVTCK